MWPFDLLFNRTPTVKSVLPRIAVNEILSGRLPILNTDRIFMKGSEKCHYIDKAIYEKKIVRKRYVRRSSGYNFPTFFNIRYNRGSSEADVKDNIEYITYKGILYVTNKRIIFQGESEGFDFKLDSLVAIQPYDNCVELQCSKENYKIFVPDGGLVHAVIQLIK